MKEETLGNHEYKLRKQELFNLQSFSISTTCILNISHYNTFYFTAISIVVLK